jgi:hypothetical protein
MVGDFLASDVMGPININSNGYNVIVLVDQLSRFLLIKAMECSLKSEDLIELIQEEIAKTQ